MVNRRDVLAGLPAAALASSASAAPPSRVRPLTAQGEVNLAAFARLMAHVRFFHAGDAAASADWNAFAVSTIETVETAASPGDLAARLGEAFGPLTPRMTIHGGPPPAAKPAEEPTDGRTLVMWRHRGVGLKTNPLYNSARIPVPGGKPRIMLLDLGGGVTAVMPVTAYSADPALQPQTPSPPLDSYSPDDRAVRLAGVAIAWGVLQHFYPYFDVVQTDWDAELPKALRTAATDPDAEAFKRTLERMTVALHDGHGMVTRGAAVPYLPAEWSWIERRLVVTVGAPGLPVGSIVDRIDGTPVTERLARIEPLIASATPQWRRAKAVQLLGRRPDGTPARLEGQGPDGARLRATLAPRPGLEVAEWIKAGRRTAHFSQPRPGLLYIDLNRVTPEDLTDRLDVLARARGVVLDVRRYPSPAARELFFHLRDRTLRSPIFETPIAILPDRKNVVFDGRGRWALEPKTPVATGRLVLLVGAGSMSQCESYASIFEGEKLGPIVGSTTAGTNGDINRLNLPGGYQMIFTGLRVRKHDGSTYHGVGVAPTDPVEPTLAGIRAGRDEVLERGIALADQAQVSPASSAPAGR
ncbi:S41 family peptidase [Caulobacter endophyticus]|uniref:S41 family peptidase n=1 Tax=Caulobacter endophyticus TaxID=2172652 RepID=UPI0024101329|nr:S41 family peptidase [Caulobacter endophyticus]MDG2528449.1 S41 family peptidase [Caulobacter endophyticus]